MDEKACACGERGLEIEMDERQFYIERPETKNITLVCPHCRQESSYPIRWMVRTKKNARSYMVRVDEMVACRNIRCRKRFELTGQSVVLTTEGGAQQAGPDFDPENFGNR